MRRISHRAVVTGGNASVGKMAVAVQMTQAYSPSGPSTASWPFRGVVVDEQDSVGLQEVVTSGSFVPTWSANPAEWIIVGAGGVLSSSTNPADWDDVAGYIDEYGIGWVGKLGPDRIPVDEAQWERQTCTMNTAPTPTNVTWLIPPQTTHYHVLLQPVGVSPYRLVKDSPAYQDEASFVPYLPVGYVPGTTSVQLVNSNAFHQGTTVVYDVQLVR